MQVKRWVLVALLLGSAAVGAVAIIASDVIYHHTSTNAFCTSCHSMAIQADDEYFKRSAHRSNSRGVLASCGDCHIPKTNWFVETYGPLCWELDALNPNILRERVSGAIQAELNLREWERYVAAEQTERASIIQTLASWTSISGLARE